MSSLLRQSEEFLKWKRMSEENVKGSPYRRYQNEDLEAGSSSKSIIDDCGSPFDIPRTKSAPIDRLKRWRVSYFLF